MASKLNIKTPGYTGTEEEKREASVPSDTQMAWEKMYYDKYGRRPDPDPPSSHYVPTSPPYVPTSPVYTDGTPKNLCTECGIDMGSCNPRQMCGKTYCQRRECSYLEYMHILAK